MNSLTLLLTKLLRNSLLSLIDVDGVVHSSVVVSVNHLPSQIYFLLLLRNLLLLATFAFFQLQFLLVKSNEIALSLLVNLGQQLN